jgi:hypothetical protein
MRWESYNEPGKPEPLFTRVRKRWRLFLIPLYPLAWVWVTSFALALFIDEPVQWDHKISDTHSYLVFQVHPFKSWPAKGPVGNFNGTATTKNLEGILEASDLWEIWMRPVHFQIARRLVDQVPAPYSEFYQTIRTSH